MPAPQIKPPSRLTPIFMSTSGILAFVALAADVTHHGKLQQLDLIIAPYLHEHSSAWLEILAAAFSGLGEFWLLLVLALAVGAWLIKARLWRCLTIWAFGLIGSPVLCGILKNAFAIPRPARYTFYTFPDDPGYTFPSGHTMGAVITSGLLALLWMRLRPRSPARRRAASAAVAFLAVLVTSSLVYLGVHYLTDVLGGLAISLAWLGILRFALPPAYDDAPATSPGAQDAPHPEQIHRRADSPAL